MIGVLPVILRWRMPFRCGACGCLREGCRFLQVRPADHEHAVRRRARRPSEGSRNATYPAGWSEGRSRLLAEWSTAAAGPSGCGHIARLCLQGWWRRAFRGFQVRQAGLQARAALSQGVGHVWQPKWLRIEAPVPRSRALAICVTGILPVSVVRTTGFQVYQAGCRPCAATAQKRAQPRPQSWLQAQPAQAGRSWNADQLARSASFPFKPLINGLPVISLGCGRPRS